ncbi:MAG: ATP synthase F1 subunit gamma [Clostridia bacterium]|nr:ATP synthase F1 subunit gamma [Clostridiales bacterium]MBQ1210828.1 ATP synthase F1 subunit gamma [Clostridia bacterium]
MAGVSTKEIKSRIRSLESTKQITKAMEMVASSKLRRAQMQIAGSRPYFEILYSTIQDIACSNQDFASPYLAPDTAQSKKTAFVVIAGDRGMAGGYNSNIIKLCQAEMQGKDAVILPIGKKACDYFKSRNAEFFSDYYVDASDVSVGNCFSLAKNLCRAYLAGEFDEIRVIYTEFVSVLSQAPRCKKLLPLSVGDDAASGTSDILYEPGCKEVFDAIIPEYIGGVIYGALCESRTSEHAARRMAMDSATQNATEMIDGLNLKYNQARQAAITQEITEIVAGS